MPEENQPVSTGAPTNPNLLNKNVPNPLAKNPNVHTHKVFASVGLILIGVIVILFGAAYILGFDIAGLFNSNSASEDTTTTKLTTSSATKDSDKAENWQTYKNTEAKFQIQHPADWKVESLDEWAGNPDATLTGPEGKIQFIWGDGLGGACSTELEDLKLKSATVKSCHNTADNQEIWSLFSPGGQLDTVAIVFPPRTSNRDVVLKILETYESID